MRPIIFATWEDNRDDERGRQTTSVTEYDTDEIANVLESFSCPTT